MTEAELVAAALGAGPPDGLRDTRQGLVRDLYVALRESVRWRLTGDGGHGRRVLDAHEVDPDVWRERLIEVLAGSGVEKDAEILAAARILLGAGRRAGRLALDARGAPGGGR
ncbi:hypothetical protein [Streptomyces cylindrosporus]|uniref:Uncharacterized protein n=1 Tax=Streptomyces cylindrosporus TaxID=2927583 RepID=A0ABS9Y5C2_9ACTN|nr:hypothetical protein [Streptomyces cylindrosporus]MCI3272394.1 hypothetical protein [Streptomyces cylindrosporus]